MSKFPKKRSITSRTDIQEKAIKLFKKYGTLKTSVNDIVKECNIAKGTFYNYFQSKDDLINSIFEEYLNEFINNVISKIQYRAEINYFTESIIDFFDKNKLFLSELRINMVSNKKLKYTENTIMFFSNFIIKYINKKYDYRITQYDEYAKIIFFSILELVHKYSIEKQIKSKDEATNMLKDLLKRFFDCKQDILIPRSE